MNLDKLIWFEQEYTNVYTVVRLENTVIYNIGQEVSKLDVMQLIQDGYYKVVVKGVGSHD